MKKQISFYLFICVIVSFTVQAQTGTTPENQPAKQSQNLLFNDVYLGYGAGSIFYFTGRMKHSDDFPPNIRYINGNYVTKTLDDPSSFGTLFLGYQRSLNRVVSLGFLFGFQNFSYSGNAVENDGGIVHPVSCNDILLSGIGRVTFSYVNKPAVRMYSGIGIGITVDFGNADIDGTSYNERKLFPGGQLTLMGIRFGRAFGGFFEFGFGSYGIINGGVSYRFAD
jgi:hypothetical protein